MDYEEALMLEKAKYLSEKAKLLKRVEALEKNVHDITILLQGYDEAIRKIVNILDSVV